MKRTVLPLALSMLAAGGIGLAGSVSADVPSAPGQVYGFGQDAYAQLEGPGGVPASYATPTLLSLPGAPSAIGASSLASFFAMPGGQLYSVGSDEYGELGRATSGTLDSTPGLVSLPGQVGAVTEIDGGDSYALVVTASGQLYTWGYNASGQLGRSTTGTFDAAPALVTLPGATGPVVHASAGQSHSLVLTSTGQVFSFGDNASGELGRVASTVAEHETPGLAAIPAAAGVITQVSAGSAYSLALTASGQIYSWGNNADDALGRTIAGSTVIPAPITLPNATGTVALMSAGGEMGLATTTSGQLYTWGASEDGELGRTTSGNTTVPGTVQIAGQAGSIVAIAGRALMNDLVTSTGQLFTWGDSEQGDLGRPGDQGTPTVVAIPGPATVDAVTTGSQAIVTVVLTANPAVTTAALPLGSAAAPYVAQLSAGGATTPFTWTVVGLPAGLVADPHTGAIAGTPSAAGTSTLAVQATDRYGRSTSPVALTLTVGPSTAAIKAGLTKALPPSVIGGVIIPKLLKNKAYAYPKFPALTAGTLTVTWTWQPPTPKHHKKPAAVVIATGKAAFSEAGTQRLVVKLTAKGIARLKGRTNQAIAVTGAFTRVGYPSIVVTKAATLRGPLRTSRAR